MALSTCIVLILWIIVSTEAGEPSGGGGNTGGGVKAACINGADLAKTPTGLKRIDQLEIGDHVAVAEGVFEPITAFLHREAAKNAKGFRFTTDSGAELTLSDEHLVFVAPRRAVLAKNVERGQRLYVLKNDSYDQEEVTAIERTELEGRYSPLTPSGVILVNDILVSCYSQIEDHHLMHRIVNWLLPFPVPSSAVSADGSLGKDGMHWVGELLWHHFRFWFISNGSD